MNFVKAITFLHTEFLMIAIGVAFVLRNVLPERRWTLMAALVGGIIAAGVAAILGWVPLWGQLHFAAYAVFMLLGFTAAYLLVRWRGKYAGIDERDALDLVMIAVGAGIIGARARYVWERPELFTHDGNGAALDWPARIALAVDFDRGGMVWYGGAVLAATAIVAYLYTKKRDLIAAGDLLIPAMLLGLGIGRIGCFFNGCCYGRPTDLPWGVVCQAGTYAHLVHPTQLYEAFVCTAGVAALMWFWRRRTTSGQVFALALIGYGAWRFTNEFLRGDDKIPSTLLGFPDTNPAHALRPDGTLPAGVFDTSQMTSLWLIVATLIVAGLVILHRRRYPADAAHARLVPGSIHAAKPAPAPPAALASLRPGPTQSAQ
jgi:phosphatidylglycerol:prolipoprotein diacylglycerol transferase